MCLRAQSAWARPSASSTGAPVPEGADAVVKYEIVEVLDGDGNEGSHVSFSTPAKVGENVRSAAEEAHAGDVVMRAGEVVASAGAGLLRKRWLREREGSCRSARGHYLAGHGAGRAG